MILSDTLEKYIYYKESKPDLYILHGDCLEIMPLLPKVDLVVTDPPYGIDIAKDGWVVGKPNKACAATRKNYGVQEWDKNIPTEEFFSEMFKISKNQVIFGGNYMTDYLKPSRCWIVWDKNNPDSPFADCELAWTSFNSSVKKVKFTWNGMIQGNMKEKELRQHPTQKPTAVMAWILREYSKNEESILDPYLGSGTTLVACKELNRNGIGIEINEKYCEISKKRLINTMKSLF